MAPKLDLEALKKAGKALKINPTPQIGPLLDTVKAQYAAGIPPAVKPGEPGYAEAVKKAGARLQPTTTPTRLPTVPRKPGAAGPENLTPEAAELVRTLAEAGSKIKPDPWEGDPGPRPMMARDSTMTVSGGMPENLFPPLALDLAAKPAGGGGPDPETAAPAEIPAAAAPETPAEAKFRKAGLLDALQAMAAGMVGRDSEYNRQRAEFQARQNALMAQATEEASRLRLMAEEARAQGDERKADRLFTASENAKERAMRERLAAGEAGAKGQDAQTLLFRKMAEAMGVK